MRRKGSNGRDEGERKEGTREKENRGEKNGKQGCVDAEGMRAEGRGGEWEKKKQDTSRTGINSL